MNGSESGLPLAGIRVLDFGHTVMGPTAGLMLADLGAEVIRVEPAPQGDPTRRLRGFGTGYFPFYNRNKKSIAVDLKTPAGTGSGRQAAGLGRRNDREFRSRHDRPAGSRL